MTSINTKVNPFDSYPSYENYDAAYRQVVKNTLTERGLPTRVAEFAAEFVITFNPLEHSLKECRKFLNTLSTNAAIKAYEERLCNKNTNNEVEIVDSIVNGSLTSNLLNNTGFVQWLNFDTNIEFTMPSNNNIFNSKVKRIDIKYSDYRIIVTQSGANISIYLDNDETKTKSH